jgi:hypothetical protein
MKKWVFQGLILLNLTLAANVWSCCGSVWGGTPPPPPPPIPEPDETPALEIDDDGSTDDNVYKITRTTSKDWVRPQYRNEYGIYSFKVLNSKIYFMVEVNDGSVYMIRY